MWACLWEGSGEAAIENGKLCFLQNRRGGFYTPLGMNRLARVFFNRYHKMFGITFSLGCRRIKQNGISITWKNMVTYATC